MRTYSLTFTGGDTQTIPGGNYLLVYSTTNPITVQAIADGAEVANLVGVSQGVAYRSKNKDGSLREFNNVKITSASAQTVVVGVGYGDLENFAAAGSVAITNTVGVTPTKNTAIDSLADDPIAAGATEQVAAADATRRAIIVTNLPVNTSQVRVGDSGAGASNGIPLEPGQSITLETSAAIYVYNSGGSAQSVALLAIKD